MSGEAKKELTMWSVWSAERQHEYMQNESSLAATACWSGRKENMKHKSTDRDLLLTNKHGGIIHTLEKFEAGMVAKMKCGLVLVQWRDADSAGRKCKRCK